MRIVVVDDQASQREGRLRWLEDVGDIDVIGLSFEEAMGFGVRWRGVEIAVLDGHDRRSPERRSLHAAVSGVPPIAPHDNFPGPRVASEIRRFCSPDETRIVLISAYARDSDLRARRIAQSGVDYVFEHFEVDVDAETFRRAVLTPERVSMEVRRVDWRAQGFDHEPDVAAAIAAVESSPAGAMLLEDGRHSDNPENEWAVRSLRQRLKVMLPGGGITGGGPRQARAPRKAWFAEQLSKALGRDLPTDPH
jgi:CheY-like chemotaxis protein